MINSKFIESILLLFVFIFDLKYFEFFNKIIFLSKLI